MKKILKLSIPLAPKNLTLESFFDPGNNFFQNWDVQINNPDCRTADCWFVLENVPDFEGPCTVPKENIIFLCAETAQPLSHIEESASMKIFMNQFGKIFTFHQYLNPNLISSAPFLPWMINANHGNSIWEKHARDFNFFENSEPPMKTKTLSMICSTQGLTEAHRMRIRFAEQLKAYFGDSIDWFGNGVAMVDQKWEALADYRYAIVLENQSRHNVITEKIGDAFLASCYPFYWGAPNIGDVFNLKGLTSIDIEDFMGTVKKIEFAIANDYHIESREAVKQNKLITIHEFNFLNRIFQIADSLTTGVKQTINLFPQEEVSIHKGIPSGFRATITSFLHRIDSRLSTNFLELSRQFYVLFRYNVISKSILRLIWRKQF